MAHPECTVTKQVGRARKAGAHSSKAGLREAAMQLHPRIIMIRGGTLNIKMLVSRLPMVNLLPAANHIESSQDILPYDCRLPL